MADSDSQVLIVALLVALALYGLVTAVVARSKNREPVTWFVAGILIGPLAVLAILIRDDGPLVPRGYVRVMCPRCLAEQLVDEADTHFDCWRCDVDLDVSVRRLRV